MATFHRAWLRGVPAGRRSYRRGMVHSLGVRAVLQIGGTPPISAARRIPARRSSSIGETRAAARLEVPAGVDIVRADEVLSDRRYDGARDGAEVEVAAFGYRWFRMVQSALSPRPVV